MSMMRPDLAPATPRHQAGALAERNMDDDELLEEDTDDEESLEDEGALDDDLEDDLEEVDLGDDDDAEVAVEEDEDDAVDDVPAAKAKRASDDEDEDDEDVDPDDVEADLDTILKDRIAAGDDDEDEDEIEEPGAESGERVAAKTADEFTCPTCFLIVHPRQFGRPGALTCPEGYDPCGGIEIVQKLTGKQPAKGKKG